MTMHRSTPATAVQLFASLLVAVAVFAATATAAAAAATTSADRPRDLLDAVLDECSLGPGAVGCLKSSVLEYLQGGGRRDSRSLDSDELDAELIKAAGEYVERQVYESNVVPGATGRASDDGAMNAQQQQQQQPAAAAAAAAAAATTTTTARADMEMGMMQDKMLMPLMMMIKMKLKMLTPIMMALVSMKATKALILSKVAIFLVLGFIVKEFLKKSGGIPGLPIHLPGLPGSEPPSSTASPPPMYGPPQSSGYDSPSSWEPSGYSSGGGHSSSSSSDSAHSMAYSSYLPSSSSSSSGSSLSATKY